MLQSLDNAQYPRYHSIESVHDPSSSRGGWVYANRDSLSGPPLFVLSITRTQSDPFAKPTRVRVQVPSVTANFPPDLYSTPDRQRALSDYCLRAFSFTCVSAGADKAANEGGGGGWSGPKGGDVKIMTPGQNVLSQSAVVIQVRS